jgi:RNase P/RNase MRP subunit p29
MVSLFGGLLGKYVTVIYTEGGQLQVLKGILISEDDDFVKIEADYNTNVINKDAVVKIKLKKEEGADE